MTRVAQRIRNKSRQARQMRLPFPAEVFVPGTVVIVPTNDLDLESDDGLETCMRRMLAVPLDKSMLLDFLVGRLGKSGQRATGGKTQVDGLTETQIDLWRLQRMLNSRRHGQRFNWLGDGLVPRMARQAIVDVPALIERLDGLARERQADDDGRAGDVTDASDSPQHG